VADPSLAVQGGIVARLKDAGVCDGRVYDAVPKGPAYPYVSVGEGDTVGDDNSCFDASEVTVQIDVWSTDVGWPEAKSIASAVRAALKAELDLEDFANPVTTFRLCRFLRDPDGVTRHAAMQFTFLIDHPTDA
jgi:hypothetical protein